MDPNEALREIRHMMAKAGHSSLNLDYHKRLLEELADAVRGLDRWLCSGGFLPTEWEENRPKAWKYACEFPPGCDKAAAPGKRLCAEHYNALSDLLAPALPPELADGDDELDEEPDDVEEIVLGIGFTSKHLPVPTEAEADDEEFTEVDSDPEAEQQYRSESARRENGE